MAKTKAQKAADAEAKRKENIERETNRIAREAEEAIAVEAAIEDNRVLLALAATNAQLDPSGVHAVIARAADRARLDEEEKKREEEERRRTRIAASNMVIQTQFDILTTTGDLTRANKEKAMSAFAHNPSMTMQASREI